MSYASNRYPNYATFVTPTHPGEDYWDRQIHTHTTEEILLLTEEGSCTISCNGNTYQVSTPLSSGRAPALTIWFPALWPEKSGPI